MKACKFTGIICGVLAVVSLTGPVLAQGTKVALVDISLIFQENKRFAATMEDMKKDIQKFEEYVKQRRQQLQAKSEGLKQFEVGTPDYRSREATLAKESADLQVDIGLKKKEIMDREARVYYEAYKEVVNHVRAIASRHNIGIVMRYNSSQIDQNDRGSVLAGVNRSIVYQNQLDVTQLVLQSINARTPVGTPGTPAVTRGQQVPQFRTK